MYVHNKDNVWCVLIRLNKTTQHSLSGCAVMCNLTGIPFLLYICVYVCMICVAIKQCFCIAQFCCDSQKVVSSCYPLSMQLLTGITSVLVFFYIYEY